MWLQKTLPQQGAEAGFSEVLSKMIMGGQILCLQNHNHQFEIGEELGGCINIYLRVHLTPYVGSFYSGYFRTPADLFALVSVPHTYL